MAFDQPPIKFKVPMPRIGLYFIFPRSRRISPQAHKGRFGRTIQNASENAFLMEMHFAHWGSGNVTCEIGPYLPWKHIFAAEEE